MGAGTSLNVRYTYIVCIVFLNLEVFVLDEKLLSSSEITLCKFYFIHKPVDVVHRHSPPPDCAVCRVT